VGPYLYPPQIYGRLRCQNIGYIRPRYDMSDWRLKMAHVQLGWIYPMEVGYIHPWRGASSLDLDQESNTSG
jgi:hypothetical protein